MKLSIHKFTFVGYNGIEYPSAILSNVEEIAAHFDKTQIEAENEYSLHTEYSYGKRKLNSDLISNYPVLRNANKDGVPQLWKSMEWAKEFAKFIVDLVSSNTPPKVIEIHPPFNDYCDAEEFAERFVVFEKIIHQFFQNTDIVIENRAGSVYRGGKFLFSKAIDIVLLAEIIKNHRLKLGIVLDFPQLLTAENIDPIRFNKNKYLSAVDLISMHRDLIKGIHVWGKKKNTKGRWIAHCGNLNTYFNGEEDIKQTFLSGINKICDDERIRFIVPEVNSGKEDVASVIADLFL